MMVLDKDVLIEILDGRSEKGDDALKRIIESDEDIVTTSINLHEILYDLEKYEAREGGLALASARLYEEGYRAVRQNRA